MATPIKVPTFGESVTEGTIVRWLKNVGDAVKVDEALVEIETDKITVEVPAPVAGVITQTSKKEGDKVTALEVIGEMDETAQAAPTKPAQPAAPVPAPISSSAPLAMPAAARELAERGIDPSSITGSGRGGRILKEDVTAPAATPAPAQATIAPVVTPSAPSTARTESRVPITPLRRRIAERLLSSQQQAAILTTFNEVDMSQVMALRKAHQERFTERHGVKLGFMSFFIKAVVEALKAYPIVNAQMSEQDIVYHNFYDIGVAVGSGKGLVVPIIRNADQLSFAQVEKSIADFGARAKSNKLTLDEMQGGTFTITNGGIYGSMLSTPIINPPQSAILGMHNIQERAVVQAGAVVVRPIMYLALSYDHRLIDGREAVQFLVRIKECIEHPERILLEA